MSAPVHPAATVPVHPAATNHLPGFITAPGETDVLMVVMATILALAVLGFGILFLRIHTLPGRIAHKGHKLQFEIVAVLGLLALFTHIHWFWVAGLLLALIDIPHFGDSLNRIAGGVESMAGIKPNPDALDEHEPSPDTGVSAATDTGVTAPDPAESRRDAAARPATKRPELVPAATGS
jgi:hypothetical protein